MVARILLFIALACILFVAFEQQDTETTREVITDGVR